MANRFYSNAGHFYAPHVMPVLLDCNFIVDAANGNNVGVRSLKGQGIASVIGHSSAAPANSTPPAGYVQVNFSDPYFRYFGGFSGFVAPNSGSTAITAITPGLVYVIATLGTSTTANWVTAGVPVGVTPAPGVSFLAASTSSGSGTVTQPTVSGVSHIEVVGDPNATLSPVGIGAAAPYIFMKYVGATNSSTTTPIAIQPTDNTVVGLAFYLSNSSVIVAGE